MVDAPASASFNPPLAAVNFGRVNSGPGMTSKTQKASIPRRHIANTVTEDVTNHSHDRAYAAGLLCNSLDPETQV